MTVSSTLRRFSSVAAAFALNAAALVCGQTSTDDSYQKYVNPPTLPSDEITVAAPEAAALNKYVDLPVNYAFGTVDIALPLFQWTTGSFSNSVSISYSTGALRFDERSGPVGLGWAFSAGGTITRSVVGDPDEMKECRPEPNFNGYNKQEYESVVFQYRAARPL